MKCITSVIAAAIVASFATPADAQIHVSYDRKGKNWTLSLRASFGDYCGYGYGPGYGYFPAMGSIYRPSVSTYRPYGLRSYGYTSYDGFGYAPDDYAGGFVWRYPTRTAGTPPVPPVPPDPAAREKNDLIAIDAKIEDGVRRWKMGDIASALAVFKGAVAENTRHGSAQVHMALALLATGDGRNADKALRSAMALIEDPSTLSAIVLKDFFRDSKESAKFAAGLSKMADGNGALTAGLAHCLLGDKNKASSTLEALKDSEAKRLLAICR